MRKQILMLGLIATVMSNCETTVDERCRSCLKVLDVVTCAFCAGSYLNSSGVCTEVDDSISNCLGYATKTTCAFCDWGYFLTGGKCESCDSTCFGCAGTKTTCTACKDKKLVSSKCDGDSVTCIDNCKYCDNTTTCNLCDSDYALTDGKCVKFENCMFALSSTSCTICDSGYYNKGGKCIKGGVILSLFWLVAYSLIF